jgi:hypothetical protein
MPIITLIIVLVSYYLLDLGVCMIMNMDFKKDDDDDE